MTDQGVDDGYKVEGGDGGSQETGGRDNLEKPGLVLGGYTHCQDCHHTPLPLLSHVKLNLKCLPRFYKTNKF